MKAQQDFNIDLENSYMVGDKISDIQAGEAAGLTSIMVLTGYGTQEHNQYSSKVICFKNLFTASRYIFNSNKLITIKTEILVKESK